MMTENSKQFAIACIEMNALEELKTALSGEEDQSDMKAWGITASEWRAAIEHAIEELES